MGSRIDCDDTGLINVSWGDSEFRPLVGKCRQPAPRGMALHAIVKLWRLFCLCPQSMASRRHFPMPDRSD